MKATVPQSVAYVPSTTVLVELRSMEAEVSAVGVSADDTTIGGSFEGWSAVLVAGQTAWIYSLTRFRSITELMTYCELMQARGVVVRSVQEGWFNDPAVSGTEVLGSLFRLGAVMHERVVSRPLVSVRQRNGRLSGQLVSSAQRAVELRASGKLSVVSACRLAGCGVNAYYRYLKEQQ